MRIVLSPLGKDPATSDEYLIERALPRSNDILAIKKDQDGNAAGFTGVAFLVRFNLFALAGVAFEPLALLLPSMLITLTTDFGLRDPFVGVMKGVIAQINPSASVVDLTHGIAPQDVLAAAMILRHATKYFPRGTIHVAVVDPGVGSARRAVLVETNEAYWVGPDNGIFSFVCEEGHAKHIVHLSNPRYYLQPTSATFHGRDIFAPVAAYLSLGVAPVAFGETLNDYVRISWPSIVCSDRSVMAEIVYIDGFGNLFSNIREQDLAGLNRERVIITLGTLTIRGLARNYAAVEKGQPLALVNSWGLVEIAANGDSAARLLHASIGDKIYLSAS